MDKGVIKAPDAELAVLSIPHLIVFRVEDSGFCRKFYGNDATRVWETDSGL